MLELDECNQLLVTNPFSDDSVALSSSNNHDTLVTLTLNSSSEHHPLRSRSVSPARRCNTSVTLVDGEGETPRLTRLLSLGGSSAEVAADSEEDQTTGIGATRGGTGSDIIIHPVGPNDSFAGVALRYGVSIAALRRANQLWPSDPIHLRTELLIPRGDTLRARHKPTHCPSTNTTLRSTVDQTPILSPDFVASSFISTRSMILSVLPTRISLDSLSSRASASEDHELDDFRAAHAPKMSDTEIPFAEAGHELSVLAAPHAQHKLPGIALPSQVPCSPTNNQRLHLHHTSPIDDLLLRSVPSSPTVSLEWQHRTQPFAVLPVRTSQLEPEPAMELPVRRSRT